MGAWVILGCRGHGVTLQVRGRSIAETVWRSDVVIATPTVLSGVDLRVAEGEFVENYAPGRPLTSGRVAGADVPSFFPPDDQARAWAHVQIAVSVGDSTPDLAALDVRVSAAPDSGIARLVSHRRPAPNTAYHAFVGPTFEVGRKADLGLTSDDDM